MLLKDALSKFTIQWEANGRSPHTIGQYKRHILLFERWLQENHESEELDNIDHELVARFLASPHAKARSDGIAKKASSANALRASMRGFFRYLHDAGYVAKDPTRFVRKASCAPAPPRALSEKEIQQLRDAFSKYQDPASVRDRVLFELLLQTGIRLGSALAMDAQDFDRDRKVILLRSTKGNRPTCVTLQNEMVGELAERSSVQSVGPMFTNPSGIRLTARTFQRRFQNWLSRADVEKKASPHSLRHTFATNLYLNTKDFLGVKNALSHRSFASTLVYVGSF